MKKKKLQSKLTLKKVKIADLNQIKGGKTDDDMSCSERFCTNLQYNCAIYPHTNITID